MTNQNFHGINFHEDNSGPFQIRLMGTSIIGIIGKATSASDEHWPAKTPVLVSVHPDKMITERQFTGADKEESLYLGLKAIFDEQPCNVIAIRIKGDTDAEILEAIQMFEKAASIVGKVPKILCTNGYIADKISDTLDQKLDQFRKTADKIRAIVVADLATKLAKPTPEISANTLNSFLDDAEAEAESETENPPASDNQEEPKEKTSFDKYATELEKYLKKNKDKRIYPIYGGVKVFKPVSAEKSEEHDTNTVEVPASCLAAALMVKNDLERKWSQSPSNLASESIVSLSSPVSFDLADSSCEAAKLNALGVACFINHNGDFLLWGNKGLGTLETDKKWQFINIVRTYDIMLDSLLAAHIQAMDKGITPTYVEDVATSQNIFYSQLMRDGHIVKAECIPSKEKTTSKEVQEGNVYWQIKWCGVYPANYLDFETRMETAYLKDFLQ